MTLDGGYDKTGGANACPKKDKHWHVDSDAFLNIPEPTKKHMKDGAGKGDASHLPALELPVLIVIVQGDGVDVLSLTNCDLCERRPILTQNQPPTTSATATATAPSNPPIYSAAQPASMSSPPEATASVQRCDPPVDTPTGTTNPTPARTSSQPQQPGARTFTKQCAWLVTILVLSLASTSYSWPGNLPVAHYQDSCLDKALNPEDCWDICESMNIDIDVVFDSWSSMTWEKGLCSFTISNPEPSPIMLSLDDVIEMCEDLQRYVSLTWCEQYIETKSPNLAVEMSAEREQLPSYTGVKTMISPTYFHNYGVCEIVLPLIASSPSPNAVNTTTISHGVVSLHKKLVRFVPHVLEILILGKCWARIRRHRSPRLARLSTSLRIQTPLGGDGGAESLVNLLLWKVFLVLARLSAKCKKYKRVDYELYY